MIKLIECPLCGEKSSINLDKVLTNEEMITFTEGYCFCCQQITNRKEKTKCQEEKMK